MWFRGSHHLTLKLKGLGNDFRPNRQAKMAQGVSGDPLVMATQELTTSIATYTTHAKSVRGLMPKEPSAKAKAKAKAKAEAKAAAAAGDSSVNANQ